MTRDERALTEELERKLDAELVCCKRRIADAGMDTESVLQIGSGYAVRKMYKHAILKERFSEEQLRALLSVDNLLDELTHLHYQNERLREEETRAVTDNIAAVITESKA